MSEHPDGTDSRADTDSADSTGVDANDASPSNELRYHVDGELVPASRATVRVDDRGFRYGDAAFETLRAYGGTIFEWDAHAARLEATCDALELTHGLSRADLLSRIDETLSANDLSDAYVRLSITRGVQPGKLTPDPDVDPTVVVYVGSLPRGGLEGNPVWDGPAALETVDTRRIPNDAVPASAKTHNYLNGILARQELESGDEALLCDGEGYAAEGATSNVFFVEDGALYTPATDGPVLPGITRRVVLECAADAGIPVEEGRYRPERLRDADRVFLTNTTWELRPVASVDGVAIERDDRVDDDPLETLSRMYDERVEDRCY
ncbi:branched-chain amino acid aminotransferase [Halostagnicola larsenii XH-48]|uniref:Branched-chain amino acid aminotransferase n=1 Tax=Halostagnicola larsenii XH-48 TaxID=797299 RepID=W0JN28_9EURY|nr:aminotransferase class IV [Halostagnicola larsenii]AHF98711.1 branched-chain amino acid aminotransferase [Halostagnicola larsenii XH-48]